MKIALSTFTLLLAVASAIASFDVQAEEDGSTRRSAPAQQSTPKGIAPKPALAASAPSASQAPPEPLALCACVRPRPQA